MILKESRELEWIQQRNYSGTPDLTINIRKREAFATLI